MLSSQIRRALGHLIRCKEATRLVSQMQDRNLGPVERFLLKFHLGVCAACKRFETQVRFLRLAMRKYRE